MDISDIPVIIYTALSIISSTLALICFKNKGFLHFISMTLIFCVLTSLYSFRRDEEKRYDAIIALIEKQNVEKQSMGKNKIIDIFCDDNQEKMEKGEK